jgi:hypothetical protein
MGVGSGGYAERCRCSASSSHWCANSSYRRLLSSCQQRFASSRHSAACARNPSVLASKSRRQTGRSAMKSSVVMAISHQFHRWLAGYCDRWVRAVIAITKRHFALGGRPSSRLAGKTNVLSVGYRVPTPPCMEPSVLDADRLEARASAWNLVRLSSVMFDGICLPHGNFRPCPNRMTTKTTLGSSANRACASMSIRHTTCSPWPNGGSVLQTKSIVYFDDG